MWPTLLNLSRDECRRTLRRLELDAYSNMINVFRAQGALEDNRKKLLEELRAVLHISSDRHNAEARRVSNDELLATIAEQLTGPNTGLGWICEGRRRIPLLPRGIAQTMYTEIADNIKGAADNENTEMENKQLEAEQLAAPRTEKQELTDTEGMTAECTQVDEPMEEMYPLATEDQSSKIWETELICRKRKITEGGTTPEDMSTPVKNMRNIPANSNQKHLNLSQIYSKYSQPATSKSSSQSKHSYNQVSKVSTSKSSQHPTRVTHKHRAHRQSSKNPTQVMSKSHKKSQELSMSPGKQYNPTSMHLEYAGAPNSFQATYAQSILGSKKPDFMDDMKPKVLSSPGMVSDSPTMQLLTQPATVPHELGVSDNAHPDDHTSLQAQSTPVKQQSAKPCHLILKKRSDVTHPAEKKVQMPEFKILQKPDGVKVISSRQVVVAPSSTHKVVNTTAKIGTTKIIGSLPKSRPSNPHNMISEKMIVVSKPSSMDNRIMSNSKIIVTSSAVNTHSRETKHVSTNSLPPRSSEQTLTAKGIPATDLKVSAKTFVLNPKSGQKMVVLPAKNRTKTGKEGQMPLLHFKGIPTAMKLVPVTSQHAQPAKTSAVTVVSRPAAHALPSTKIVSVEPIKTANLADIVPVKGLAPVTTPKITNPIVRPGSAKGGLIVVQKGTTIGKTLKFTKNGNDTKIIMGKNVNQLLQAAKPEQAETGKSAGNVIVLELNNEQSGQPTTMSEILDSRGPGPRVPEQGKPAVPEITQDTPVLFDSQLAEETCNANSMDSTCGSLGDIVPMEDSTLRITDKDEVKASLIKDGKDSCVTDWEMELDTVSKKGKDDDDKLNSLHLDLGMSSDSESEFMVDPRRRRAQGCPPRPATTEHNEEIFSSTRGFSLATRTLLSQLQDDGSSSNDSSFALKSKCLDKAKKIDKIDKSESEALVKAKEKLSEKVAEPTSQQKRIDIYSTAITSTDMNLDPFSYLDEGMLVGDDVFESRRERRVEDQLGRLLADDSANSTDSQAVSEGLPFTK